MTDNPRPLYGDSFIPTWPAGLPVPYNGPFRAKVVEVHDGDTATCDISTAFDQRKEQVIRIYGVNAPELSTPEGVAARDFLRSLIPPGSPVRVTPLLSSVGQFVYTFGRCVAQMEFMDGGKVADVAMEMVANGHAAYCDRNLKVLVVPPPPIRRWAEPA